MQCEEATMFSLNFYKKCYVKMALYAFDITSMSANFEGQSRSEIQ